ncbi:MAG: hypothetical protein ACPG80_00725, partial [Rickettsiales bacterium]
MTENYVITIIAGTARQKLDEVDFAAVHEASHAQGFRTGAPHWLSLHTACDIPLMGEASDDRAWVRALADDSFVASIIAGRFHQCLDAGECRIAQGHLSRLYGRKDL